MSNLFNNIDSINESVSISILEDNIKMFLDYALLQIGSFVNVSIPTQDINDTNGFHILRHVNDPSLQNRVWETQRKDLIYESEIQYNNTSPIDISGIYINDVFVPLSDTGPYSYKLNYPLGRVIFNKPIDTSFQIKMAYSYRYIQTLKSSGTPWITELQKYSFDSSKFSFFGDHFVTGNHRIQLPCIIIDLAPRTVLLPYELGSIKNYIIQDVLFHVLAENKNKSINICDMLLAQKDNTFNLYDILNLVKSSVTDLDQVGQKNSHRIPYFQLDNHKEYIKNRCIIKNSTITGLNSINNDLHSSLVRWSVEIFP